MHFIFDENVEEGEEGEGDGELEGEGEDVEDVLEDEDLLGGDDDDPTLSKAPPGSLFVPEVDFGPRFVASPEPDELFQDASSSPDR